MSLRLEIDGAVLEAPEGATLFDCAERARVRVPTSCHKNGKCRECMVEVVEGMDRLSPRTAEEEHLAQGFRLACRARVAGEGGTGGGTGSVRCHTMRRGAMRIESESSGLDAPPAPLDPAVKRAGGRVFIDGEPVAEARGPIHGLAVDAGTTTVVLRLLDLGTGALVASTAFENPQRFGGSDVMARIRHDTDHPGRLLQRVLLAYIGHAIEDFPCDPETIFEVVVAGNSTMRDLFFGLDVYTIGQRPYRSVTEHELLDGKRSTTSLTMPARRLHLPAHAAARVYGLPVVSGHVGADAAACILATGLLDEERLVAVMDIGTNTEILVGNRDRVFAASCPAGPAFEGGLVMSGMPALDGAIESVRLEDDGSVRCGILGGGPPRGICGSGLVDLLAELLRAGRMDLLGRFADGSDRIVVDAERGIGLSELDVSHLAQAKGANVAGLSIVLEQAGIDLDEIEVFYLAGGFAKNLRLDSARRIGFVPDLPDSKLRQVGNAAVAGATIALLSASRRHRLEAFVRRAVHVELEADPGFFDHFVDGCQFQPVRRSGAGARGS